jgi:hypothetical protein
MRVQPADGRLPEMYFALFGNDGHTLLLYSEYCIWIIKEKGGEMYFENIQASNSKA